MSASLRLSHAYFIAVKLIGKLEDGTEFLKKGYGEEEEPFEFKTDEGKMSFTAAASVTMMLLY